MSLLGAAPGSGGQSGLGNSTLFGSGLQSQGNKPGLFGSTANTTAAKPSLFGASTTTPAAGTTGGSLFGASTAAPAAATGGGLFGTKPGFTTSAFGNTAAATTHPSAAQPTATQSTIGGTDATKTSNAYFDTLLEKSKKQANGEGDLGDVPSIQLGLGDIRAKLKGLSKKEDRTLDGKAHYLLAGSGVDFSAAAKDLSFLGAPAGRIDRPTGTTPTDIDVEAYLANVQNKTTLSMIADSLERSVQDFDNFLEDNVTMEWETQRKRIYEHFGIKLKEDVIPTGSVGLAKDSQGGFGRSRRSKAAKGTPGPGAKSAAGNRVNTSLHKSVLGTPARIGAHQQSDFTDVTTRPDSDGLPNSGATPMDDRFLREKQSKFAEQVRNLNASRVHKMPFAVLHHFAHIESTYGDRQTNNIVEAYNAVIDMVGENPDAENDRTVTTPKERQFAKAYLDPNSNSQPSLEIRKKILSGATEFLEKQFFKEVEALIAKFPREANLGGRPDVVSKIKAYIRIRAARKDLVPDNTLLQQVGDEYVWAIVFYLLRSGYANEATKFVNNNPGFKSIDRTFGTYLNEYSSHNRMLNRLMNDRCNQEYTQKLQNLPKDSIDPFRVACYKIIGRCQLQDRSLPGLNTDVNDWIWLQFNLAREVDRSTELANQIYTLKELQQGIKEIGQKHFPKTAAEDSNGSFGMFFYLQILAGMFEQAIAYLYNFSYVDAIHFAVALEYYGLLRASDHISSGNNLLSINTREQPQINFGRMLGYYTRDFRAADVVSAVDYLVLICLNMDLPGDAGRLQAHLCYEALRELVLETREFSKLIGDIRHDGHRIHGVIEERGELIGLGDEDDFVRTVTMQAANFADENGRVTDSVLLYHLAGDYDSVIAIVSRALSEAISLELGEDPMRLVPVKPRVEGQKQEANGSLSLAAIDDPVELARNMMQIYERDVMFHGRIQDENKMACRVLLQMSEIKKQVEQENWTGALDNIISLDILPLNVGGDPGRIRQYASKFSSLPQPVAINVAPLLTWTILCCTQHKQRMLQGKFSSNEGSRRQQINAMRQMTLDLTAYTSQLRYRFPPHIHELLARASVD